MNAQERFLETITFDRPDRVIYQFGGPRAATLWAWQKQGLPESVNSSLAWCQFVGSDPVGAIDCVNVGLMPPLEGGWTEDLGEGKVLAVTPLRADEPDGPVWRAVSYKPEYQPTPGFETHHVIEAAVRDRKTFEELIKRYDPSTPGRYQIGWQRKAEEWNRRDYPLSLCWPGLWMQARHWCKLEELCLLCADDPDLVKAMFDFWVDYLIELYRPLLDVVSIDEMLFDEDIAFKGAAFISPEMVRKLMWPAYRKAVRFFRDRGVRMIGIASDGYLGDLIDVWLDVGANAVHPLEIAAGNDLIECRKRYGKNLIMRGGIDKRALLTDKQAIRDEVFSKVPFLLDSGGYIPGIDHAVPPDVPLRNFLYYIELIKEIGYGGTEACWEPTGELEKQCGPIERMWSPDQVIGSEIEILTYQGHIFRPRQNT